jgi:hypothetical protein
VVAVILTAMFSPAAALAKSEPRTAPAATEQAPAAALTRSINVASSVVNEAARYAQREQTSQDQQNIKGGAVNIVAGSGLVLVLLIVLIVLIV